MASVGVQKFETEDLTKHEPYTVRMYVTNSLGISPNLFVTAVEDDLYKDVASAEDLLRYPSNPAEAWPEVGYYRSSSMTKSFQRKVDLRSFVDAAILAIKQTCKDWSGESEVELQDPVHLDIEGP